MPLTAFYFQQVSLVGLPTTLVTLPMLPFALVFHALTSILGLVFQPLGTALGWLAWGATTYIVQVVHLAAKLPVASFETGRIAPALVLVYYGVGGSMVRRAPERCFRKPRKSCSVKSNFTPRILGCHEVACDTDRVGCRAYLDGGPNGR